MSGTAGYLGAMASISAEDVPALYEGAKFYSPAVGDAGRSSVTSWLAGLLERNGPVPLMRVESVAPDTQCVAVCVLGSGSAMADLPPAGDEFVLAVRQIERLQKVRFGAVYPLAAATISALVPVVTAAQLGVPLLDADGMGRTFALIHHTAMHLAGVSPTPLVAVGPTGESVLVEVLSGPRADRMLRANVDTVGGWAALAAYPVDAGTLRRAALPGTMSRITNVGRVLLETTDPEALVTRLGAITGCRRVARGRIAELEHLSRQNDVTIPAHPSSLVVEETGGLGRQLRIELRSEIVAVFADGALIAGAPDLMCLLDVSRGALATLDSLEPGDLIDVLVTPADAVWYSPEGMEMVGLASHGIPLEHPRRR
ncbi:hypothetical protein Ade02nite_29410 [Paractinoplanes deccanensis]|uniref:DUF917 domain-containing protein n=1 Tax=Paractinoplanes deccanensis TaxID=113561 RepID=A0ABQ3Y2V1_9ACTN|nr:DUF917 domain-containing protein [Actinoplanes deccanensis]GID74300.1 hypothetical protein Ade02nite_29410 [Actinoplanes deccanensis]